jgi:hypothetical protein
VRSLLLVPLAGGQVWIAHRNARLNAARLLAQLHPNAHVHRRVAAQMTTADGVMGWLQDRRGGPEAVNRYEEEGYLLAFEARLKELGQPKIPQRTQAEIRKASSRTHPGLGLATDTALFTIWEQCVARWHAHDPDRIPRSVKLIITGCRHLDAVEEDVAVLLNEDAYLRRRKNLPPDRFPNLREQVIREWVAASGGTQAHLDRVERMLGRNKDDRLAELAEAGDYARLAPEMVDLARNLAHAVAPGDANLAFYAFRVLQRVAASTVENEAMWKATWLRGEKTDPNAIPGTSSRQSELNEILKTRIFEEEPAKGHSGAASIATTYRLRLEIRAGDCGPQEAAQMLGIRLNSKGRPRRVG